jgi:hypothetical protein
MPDGRRECGVTRLVGVAAVIGEEAGRVRFQAVATPFPAPALQQRGLRVQQQAVEVEDQRRDRHSAQYPVGILAARRSGEVVRRIRIRISRSVDRACTRARRSWNP